MKMVADAVVVKPVSTRNFVANREFYKIAAFGAPETRNNSVGAGC